LSEACAPDFIIIVVCGARDRSTWATAHQNQFMTDFLTALYERLGQREKAEPLFIGALMICEQIYVSVTPSVLETLAEQSRVHSDQTKPPMSRPNPRLILQKAPVFQDPATISKMESS
jgi:hypothetical protein